MECLPRRHFLQVLVATAALPRAMSACSSSGAGPEAFGDVSGGTVAALPVGSLRIVAGVSAAIGRDARGIYAMTLTCTHQACDIAEHGTVSPAGISCACHGSTFDVNGAVTAGPATAPLVHFAVSADTAGNVTVHGGQQVDAATRLAV